jgi:myosin heavy subunit
LFADRFWSGNICDPVSLSPTGFVPAGLLYLKRERLAQLLAVFHRKKSSGGPMGKVYESLKEVVKLQRSKNDPVALAGVKHTHASSLDEEINELEQKISRLQVAVKHHEEAIRKEAQQVIQTLSEDFAMLETKLRDAEEIVRSKESESQKMEESLTAKVHGLQNELNTEKETLQSRDNEIKDLKSNVDSLVKQVTALEIAIKQAKAEAATEANRTQQLAESSNTKIAALEAQSRDIKEIVRSKESTINGLEQNLTAKILDFETQLRNREKLLAGRDTEINDLKSKLQVLTGKIKEMSSFLKQAEALAFVEEQNSRTLAASEPLNGIEEKPVGSPFEVEVPAVTSNERTNVAQQTVSPDFFDLMSQELAVIKGHQAPMIVRKHVVTLGESMEKFPKSRLAELLETLSKEIKNEPLRIGFRMWFVKHAGGWTRLDV